MKQMKIAIIFTFMLIKFSAQKDLLKCLLLCKS